MDAPDDGREYCSKHVEQPMNNKLPYTVASFWSFSYTSYIMRHGNMNMKYVYFILSEFMKKDAILAF
jgi:hypothetical protein